MKNTLQKVQEFYRESRQASSKWRKEARELYAFRAGHQWDEEDISYLEEQKRPPVTFNRAGTVIDAVMGSEISNRQEIRYLPRTQEDGMLTETATGIAKWVRDNTDAEDEESDAFEDVLISGLGWTETRIDYEEDPDGKICIERVDPLEMYWDPNANKHNITDAKFFIRVKWMASEDVKSLWPGKEVTPTEYSDPDLEDVRNADPPYYERESTGIDYKRGLVRVLECQWCEKEKYHRVENPLTGQVESLSGEKFKVLQKRFPDIRHASFTKRVWYRAFVAGGTLLEEGDAPIKEECSFKAITGKRDRKENAFYGLMRGMKEPQEWANKFFSQVLHIINSNSKGGFFFETGALRDPNQAREDLAKPEGMVELNPGGLNRIRERQMFQFPTGIDRMMEFAISSIRDVPGVNLELLGAVNRDQAGVVETQRQRQALTVLAPIFSNLRRYRKEHGRLLLKFVRDYLEEGKLIRVVGPEGQQVVPLVKSQIAADYDMIVEQAPTSPNARTEAWVALQAVMPTLQQAGIQPPPDVIDVLPLPASLLQKWKARAKEGLPPKVQEQMQKMQEDLQGLSQENQQLKLDKQEKMIELEMKQKEAVIDQQIQVEKLNADREKSASDLQLKKEIAIQAHALEVERMQREFEMKAAELEMEHKLKLLQLTNEVQLKQAEAEANIGLQKARHDEAPRG